MANIITHTEDLTHADWTAADSLIVTANVYAAPVFAGGNAGMADTLDDQSAGLQGQLISPFRTIPNDASDWVTSVYLRKDAVTTRWPEIGVQLANGTGVLAGIQVDTSAGLVTDAPLGAPAASGIINVDALWWRVWLRVANNASGNTDARLWIFPSHASSFGGGSSSAATGLVAVWGVNQTNTTAIQAYEPDPFYAVEVPGAIIFKNRLA